MELKHKLELLKIKNKFNTIHGINKIDILDIESLKKDEKDKIEKIRNGEPVEVIPLCNDYGYYEKWAIKRIIENIGPKACVILFERYHPIYIDIEDMNIFLKQYFALEGTRISLISRDKRKCLVIRSGEYNKELYVEYLN